MCKSGVDLKTTQDLAVTQNYSNWSVGYRIEHGLNAEEMDLLIRYTHFSNDKYATLMEKLWKTGNGACDKADKLYSLAEKAHALDIPNLQQKIFDSKIAYEKAKAFSMRSQADIIKEQEEQNQELVQLKKYKEKMAALFKNIEEHLQCTVCMEVSILPKVLGACGHILCQNCLNNLDNVAYETLTSSEAVASTRQHLLARRCPLCRAFIVSSGFPVLPLKEIVSTLILHGCIEVPDNTNILKLIASKVLTFEQETAEQRHLAAVQLELYTQSELAQHSVSEVIPKITREQWIKGVLIQFASANTRIFFEAFAATMQGKAGGVNVFVNAAQRLLLVQLVFDAKRLKADMKLDAEVQKIRKENLGYRYVTITADGKFTLATSIAGKIVADPATQSYKSEGSSGGLPALAPTHAVADSKSATEIKNSVGTSAGLPAVESITPPPKLNEKLLVSAGYYITENRGLETLAGSVDVEAIDLDVEAIDPANAAKTIIQAFSQNSVDKLLRQQLQVFKYSIDTISQPLTPALLLQHLQEFKKSIHTIESLVPSLQPSTGSAGGRAYEPYLDIKTQLSNWTPGFKVEQGLEHHEASLLKTILSSTSATPPSLAEIKPSISETSSFNALITKLWRPELTTEQFISLSPPFETNFGAQYKTQNELLIKKLWTIADSAYRHVDHLHSMVEKAYTNTIPELQRKLSDLTAALKTAETFAEESQSVSIKQPNQELVSLRKYKESMGVMFNKMKLYLECPKCNKIAILPKVVGTCGHTLCQDCLKQIDEETFATLTCSGSGASARRHLLAKRCPVCQAQIMGTGFPVLALKDLLQSFILHCIETPDSTNTLKQMQLKPLGFEKETTEQQHRITLQLACYMQMQKAQDSVSEVINKITREQWITGIYIEFDSATSLAFFETFATTMYGRAGGVKVLVIQDRRMLGVQLDFDAKRLAEDKKLAAEVEAVKKKKHPNLLVTVATDGKFTVTNAVFENVVANPNTAAQSPAESKRRPR